MALSVCAAAMEFSEDSPLTLHPATEGCAL